MRIAVLSGKGGAGKTFVSTNLAASFPQAVYLDCDVEEPNGRLFFKPQQIIEKKVHTLLPSFDPVKCSGCRKCVDFCHFNALVYIRRPHLFDEICHSCGGCKVVCPEDAVVEVEHEIGLIETGYAGAVKVCTGILHMGEASGVPLIRALLKESGDPVTIIDCPPGSACSVMESAGDADYCIMVAEPTAFGLHNIQMIHQLLTLLGKPFGLIINKETEPYGPLDEFCRKEQIPVLGRIPYDPQLSTIIGEGRLAVQEDLQTRDFFQQLAETLMQEVRP